MINRSLSLFVSMKHLQSVRGSINKCIAVLLGCNGGATSTCCMLRTAGSITQTADHVQTAIWLKSTNSNVAQSGMHLRQDSEVHVPRYLSAKEKARQAAEAEEEEERARAQAGNDVAARALKQMMNGSLAGLPGGTAQVALARPVWMEGDPTQFTPEQQQEVCFCSCMGTSTTMTVASQPPMGQPE